MADTTRAPKHQKLAESAEDTTHLTSPAFYLAKLRASPPDHNVYSKSLTGLLEGEYTRCLLTNYMYDLPWLFSECPRLQQVPVLLVHGERDKVACVANIFDNIVC
ncbi:putative tyrosyl-DNA phosphodiesterase I [Plasmopara halstedii]